MVRPAPLLLLLLLLLLVALAPTRARASASAPAPTYDSVFWQHWGDGRAEIASYVVTRPRYGEMRSGRGVLIFVTEPWSVRNHAKADGDKHQNAMDDKREVIQTLKLNTVEDFQTGIYDYHLMTSSWTAIDAAPGRPPGSAAKISFSAQEWCGTTWHDVTFDARSAADVVRSYFESESAMRMLDNPAGDGKPALVEDNVLVWARGLAAPVVARGGSTTVALLPALARSRLEHKPLSWTQATLARDERPTQVTVPAGTFAAERAVVTTQGRTIEIFIEAAAPRRIIKIAHSDGTVWQLKGSVRTAYWKQSREGDERALEPLGLAPINLGK